MKQMEKAINNMLGNVMEENDPTSSFDKITFHKKIFNINYIKLINNIKQFCINN